MVTLQQVKDYLWITGSSQDTRLQAILDWVNQEVEAYIWDYTLGEKTIQVPKTSIKKDTIGLMHVNATSITSIDGKTIEESEYMIQDDATVYVKSLYEYIDSEFPSIKVVYVAWYETAPYNIISSVATRVGFEFSKQFWQVVKMEEMWPRSVEFFGNEKSSEQIRQEFLKSLRGFIPLYLRIWG